MSEGYLTLLLSGLFVGLLAWGLWTNEMPTKGSWIKKAQHPKLYWTAATVLAGFALTLGFAAYDIGL